MNRFFMLAQAQFGRAILYAPIARLIAADWLDDRGEINASIVAAWLRTDEEFDDESGYGSGSGSGSGYGSGYGYG